MYKTPFLIREDNADGNVMNNSIDNRDPIVLHEDIHRKSQDNSHGNSHKICIIYSNNAGLI